MKEERGAIERIVEKKRIEGEKAFVNGKMTKSCKDQEGKRGVRNKNMN